MLDPIAFTIFGLKIHWYGIIYSLGFLLSYFFIIHYSKYYKLNKDQIENLYLYFIIFSVLGGRIFEIIIYNPIYYLSNPIQIIAVWNGGMSIHGGILGGFLTLLYFSRKYNINILKLTDLFSIPAALGLSFGRLANFVNQELIGTPTTSQLGIIFPLHDKITRWPYQLFVSAKNMIIFQALYLIQEFKETNHGTITAWFLILYNFGRFFLDFLREPTISLGIISMGQLLCLIYGIIGIILLIKITNTK